MVATLKMINHEVREGRDHCIPFSLLFFLFSANFETYLFVKDFQAIPSASEWLKFSDFPSYLSNQYLPSCLGVTSKKHVFFFFCLPSKLHFLLSVCCNILSALLSANVSPFLWPWPIFIISHPAICHGLLFPASHPQSLFSTSPSWSLPWNIHLQWFHSTQKPMDSFWIW